MTQQANENVLNTLNSIIEDHGGEQHALAATYLRDFRGEMTTEEWEDFSHNHTFEAIPPNLNGVLKRMKFSASQLMKLYDLTYALQAVVTKPSKDGKHWCFVNGEPVLLSDKELDEPKNKNSKMTKTQINSIRSFYHEQIVKELPKATWKVFQDFISMKGSFNYSANEIRLLIVDSDFQNQGLADVQEYVPDYIFKNNSAEQRKFLFDNFYHYTKSSGKSQEKFGPYMKKLLNNTLSKMAKLVSNVKNNAPIDSTDAKTLLDIYYKYVPDARVNVSGEDAIKSEVSKISTNTFDAKIRSTFGNGYKSNDYTGRSDVIADMRNLSAIPSLGCNMYLIHAETIANISGAHKTRETIEDQFNVVSEKQFHNALEELKTHEYQLHSNSDADAFSDISSIAIDGSVVRTDDAIGSERLNSSIFKTIGAHCSSLNKGKDQGNRKRFSPELEKVILHSDMMRNKLLHINDKSNKASKKSKKDDGAFILSNGGYKSLTDLEMKAAFANYHRDEDYGYVHTSNMYLSSASKLHDNIGLVGAPERLGFDKDNVPLFDAILAPTLYALINQVALPTSVFAAKYTAKPTKVEKPSSGYISKNKAVAPTSGTRGAPSSPSTKGRSVATSGIDKFRRAKSTADEPKKDAAAAPLSAVRAATPPTTIAEPRVIPVAGPHSNSRVTSRNATPVSTTTPPPRTSGRSDTPPSRTSGRSDTPPSRSVERRPKETTNSNASPGKAGKKISDLLNRRNK